MPRITHDIKSAVRELAFERKDIDIFAIPDVRTRLDTLQQYFFPRLDILLNYSVSALTETYAVNPLERLGVVYHPNHRKDAIQNKDMKEVLVGLSGKRRMDRILTVTRKDGRPYRIHQTDLMYRVDNEGLAVYLPLFHHNVDSQSLATVADALNEHIARLSAIFALTHVSPLSSGRLVGLPTAFTPDSLGTQTVWLRSPVYHLPAGSSYGLPHLVMAFVALFPVLEALIAIGEGEPSRLGERLDSFERSYLTGELSEIMSLMGRGPAVSSVIDLPELPSYSFVRPGLWWWVLARDKFKCCSCGRSAKDGITLHVDHIVPRSLGGTNNADNLQALCWKCNLGKSNKSTADLRDTPPATDDHGPG
jgi:HNH endonuclease